MTTTATATHADVPERYLCSLTGKVMHVPVRLRENHDGFPVYRMCVCERKALLAMMGGDPVFTGLTTTELRALVEPVVYLSDEIRNGMSASAAAVDAAFEAARTNGGVGWRVNKYRTYERIRGIVPQALHLLAPRIERDEVHAFMDARCQGDMWVPRDEDFEMAAEISRWHTSAEIRGDMYHTLSEALELPRGSLSESQKDLARNGYFHAMESHWRNTEDHGGRVVWILNGVKWILSELAQQEWDNSTLLQHTMHRTVCMTLYLLIPNPPPLACGENVTQRGGVLSELEQKCVRTGYIGSVNHCEYTDKQARVDWAVNWAVNQISESRAKTNASHQAMVDEALRNEAKQSRKRERELYREDRKESRRMTREAPSMSRNEVLKKPLEKRTKLMAQHDLLCSLEKVDDALKHITEQIAHCDEIIEYFSRGRAV